jgi:hypothetical protein
MGTSGSIFMGLNTVELETGCYLNVRDFMWSIHFTDDDNQSPYPASVISK